MSRPSSPDSPPPSSPRSSALDAFNPANTSLLTVTHANLTLSHPEREQYMSANDLENLPPLNDVGESISPQASSSSSSSADAPPAPNFPRAHLSTLSPGSDATEVFCLTFSSDSKFLACGCGDGGIRVYKDGKLAYNLHHSLMDLAEPLPITCLRFRPNIGNASSTASTTTGSSNKSLLLSGCASGLLSYWHIPTQSCLFTIQEADNQIYAIDYRNDGKQFISAGRDGKVRVYEEVTKSLLQVLHTSSKSIGHSSRIYSVQYLKHDNNIAVSAGWDNTVVFWDIAAGHAIRSIYGPHVCGESLDVSVDGSMLLAGSWRPNEALQLFSISTLELLYTIPFNTAQAEGDAKPELLYAAAFSPDGQYIAAGGCGTNEAKVFRIEQDKTFISNPRLSFRMVEVISMVEGVYCVAFSPNGKKLAVGGGGTNVVLVDL